MMKILKFMSKYEIFVRLNQVYLLMQDLILYFFLYMLFISRMLFYKYQNFPLKWKKKVLISSSPYAKPIICQNILVLSQSVRRKKSYTLISLIIIYQTIESQYSMLLQPTSFKVNQKETAQKKHLQDLISNIIENFSSRVKRQSIFLWAGLDSLLGFKIQFTFLNNHTFVRGYLIFSNGSPICLPQIYWETFLQKLSQSPHPTIQFQIQNQLGNLFFESELKLKEECNPISSITQYMNSLISVLPLVHQQLILIGVAKKNNLYYFKSLSKRLVFITKVLKILENDLKIEQPNIFNNGEKSQEEKKGAVFHRYDQIQQMSNKLFGPTLNFEKNQLFRSEPTLKFGGYFEVEKKMCKIKIKKEREGIDQTLIKQLAVKRIKKEQLGTAHSKNKIEKQLRILYEITNPKHNVAYWVEQGANSPKEDALWQKKNNAIYMQYIQDTLNDCIYDQRNSISDVIDYSKQIIQAVSILQESGIAHRDLKPDNFLIRSDLNNSQKRQVKIIDFGQSSLFTDLFCSKPESLLGATLPYSPVQCYIHCLQGFNSSKIDVWSIGLITYQLLNKKNPISYSKVFGGDIYRGWKMPDQFCLFPKLFKKQGLMNIERVISIMTLNSVCINQKQRISLKSMKSMMEQIHLYFEQMVKI